MARLPSGREGTIVLPEDIDRAPVFERLLAERKPESYVLRLYVTGLTERSRQAITAVREFCEDRLSGRYDLEVIDIIQDPQSARDEQIVAAPTLVKREPLPRRHLIGDLSDRDRVDRAFGFVGSAP